MKHIRSTFFLLTTLFIMASCGEDRSGEYYALIGENAVSYTHLDVYKRQCLYFPMN